MSDREEVRDMESSKEYMCIYCGKGDGVMVCSETDCPIGVHEKCVEVELRVDENGRFYCLYCWYKRQLSRISEFRRKKYLAKKALADFINFKPVVGSGCGDYDDDGKENKGEENGEGILKLVNDDDVEEKEGKDDDGAGEEQCVQVEDDDKVVTLPHVYVIDDDDDDDRHSQEEMIEDIGLNVFDGDGKICEKHEDVLKEEEGNGNTCDELEDGILEEEEGDDGQVDDQKRDEKVVEGDKQAETDVLSSGEVGSLKGDEHTDSDSETLAVRQRRFDQRSKGAMRSQYPVSPMILSPRQQISKKNLNPKKNVSSSKKPRKSQESPKKFTKLEFATEKRKRLNWKPEEVDTLKEGVHKFSATVNKNIPWRKILEFGRHVFDFSRTPADLKDKWRTMTK